MVDNFIREHIKKLTPYEPIFPIDVLSEQLDIPIEALVKLDANENPYGMPPSSKERLANLSFGHIYPDPESRQLREKLADLIHVPFSNILVSSGADELIDLIMRLTMNPGDKIINCPPTFGFYAAESQINDLQIINIRRKPDFSIDYEGICQAVKEGAKVLFLANPNNPDGSTIPRHTLEKILQLPLLTIIDEAYIEFAPSGSSALTRVTDQDNLIVLRTFSKWGGLAGLRLGYGIFPTYLHEELMKIKPPYNVSVAASEAGLGALDDLDVLNIRLDWILSERNRLFQALEEIEWLLPYPTKANFILCRVLEFDAARLKQDLSGQGILIRYFNSTGLRDHVRFSVGKPQDTDRLISALKEYKQ